MNTITHKQKSNALQKILLQLEKMGNYSAKALMYISAIGAVSILGGELSAPEFRILFEGIGVNIISSIIEKMAREGGVSDHKLRADIDEIIQKKDIENLLSTNDFFRAVAKLKRGQDKIAYAIKDSEFDLMEKLDEVLILLRDKRGWRRGNDAPLPQFIAHPYTLSGSIGFYGRQKELANLSKWASNPTSSSLLIITAVGGSGKSALSWKWFTDSAPKLIEWAGMFWWSFYKTNADFDDFIQNCLAYVSQQPLEELTKLSRVSQEQMLLSLLKEKPYLIVLDGLERLAIGYTQIVSSQNKKETANRSSNYSQLRDERDARFLRQIANISHSRFLITSRVYPKDLRDDVTHRKTANTHFELKKIKKEDALGIWRSAGLDGETNILYSIFHQIHYSPLLIKVLASSIRKNRRFPGDFEQWLSNNEYSKTRNNLRGAIKNVLRYSLLDITKESISTLNAIASLHTSVPYGILSELLVGERVPPLLELRVFSNEELLGFTLEELEERGLTAWDAINNTYDMHPIIRDYIWHSITKVEKEYITTALAVLYSIHTTIDAINQKMDKFSLVELFYLLIRLKDYPGAWELLSSKLSFQLIKNDGAKQLSNMLNIFGKIAIKKHPPFDDPANLAHLYGLFSSIYTMQGDLLKARRLTKSQLAIYMHEEFLPGMITSQFSLCLNLSLSGKLKEAEFLSRDLINMGRRSFDMLAIGYGQIALGINRLLYANEVNAIKRIVKGADFVFSKSNNPNDREIVGFLKQFISSLFTENTLPWEYEKRGNLYSVVLKLTQGAIYTDLGDFQNADLMLTDSMLKSKKMELRFFQLLTLDAKTDLFIAQKDYEEAYKILDNLVNNANIQQFPLIYSSILNKLSFIEKEKGNLDQALIFAQNAYLVAAYEENQFTQIKEQDKASQMIKQLNGELPKLPKEIKDIETILVDSNINSLLSI